MKKVLCCVISYMLLFSLYACATSGEKKAKLTPTGYKMSEALGIENPEEYWTKGWKEIDTNKDGYLTMDEVVTAYPKHGMDAFPYYDLDGDGKINWGEWLGIVETSKKK